jgi:electron transfer flavoprotein alpha subunit
MPAVAVIQPGAQPVPPSGTPKLVNMAAPAVDSRIEPQLLSVKPQDLATLELEHARVIVAGGKGVGGAEGFSRLQELAESLGGTVGASRMATDLGWIGTDRLVGQTGKTVRPTVYVACGISGAAQHVLGMRESDTIVAINLDPHAPLVGLADVAAIGDLREILPALVAELGEEQ